MSAHLNPLGQTDGDYAKIQTGALGIEPNVKLADDRVDTIAKGLMTQETYTAWGELQGWNDNRAWVKAAGWLGAGCIALTALRLFVQHRKEFPLLEITKQARLGDRVCAGTGVALMTVSFLPGLRISQLQSQIEKQMDAKYGEISGEGEVETECLVNFLSTYVKITDPQTLVNKLKVAE